MKLVRRKNSSHPYIIPMHTLIMLIGIPGSGKSRWVKSYPGKVLVVSPDEIRRRQSHVSDQSRNIDVWIQAKEETIEGLLKADVILDATNVSTSYRRSFLEGLVCHKKAVIFPVDPVAAYKRVERDIRAGKDRARVPEEVIYRMFGEFLYTMKVIRDEFDGIEVVD